MTTDSIKLLPAYVDEPTHSYTASDDEAQVVDVEYIDVSTEQNDKSYREDSHCPYIGMGIFLALPFLIETVVTGWMSAKNKCRLHDFHR